MRKVLISILFITCFILFQSSTTVLADQIKYVNENGVEFTNKELSHLEQIGVSELELTVLDNGEKERYLSIVFDKAYHKVKYIKTVKKRS